MAGAQGQALPPRWGLRAPLCGEGAPQHRPGVRLGIPVGESPTGALSGRFYNPLPVLSATSSIHLASRIMAAREEAGLCRSLLARLLRPVLALAQPPSSVAAGIHIGWAVPPQCCLHLDSSCLGFDPFPCCCVCSACGVQGGEILPCCLETGSVGVAPGSVCGGSG